MALLAVTNVVTFRFRTRRATTIWNGVSAAALIGLARASGVSWSALGLSPASAARGAAVGGIGAAATAGTFGAILAPPGSRHIFDDERNADLAPREFLALAALHIPFGTVVFEELAFRGVLPALFDDPADASPRSQDVSGDGLRAALLSSALFGLWHYLSAHDLKRANPSVADLAARPGVPDPVWIVVAATGLVGVGFAAIRRTAGHVIAPAAVHLSINLTAALIPRVRARLASQA